VLPEDVRTPADVAALGRALLGDDPARAGRVLHVASVWRDERGASRVLRIGPKAPKSRHDTFLLSLARARAEALVSTGRILREEPALTHGLRGPPELRAALAAWRRERLVLAHEPWLLVLSSGQALDPMHPAFHGPARPLLFVPSAAAAALRELFAATDVRIASAAQPNVRLALDHLRRLGARRITLEAGPTTARALYDDPARIDELWLTTYAGPPPPSEVIGEPFVAGERLAAVLPEASEPCEREEASGTWRFERRWRAADRTDLSGFRRV
jgi:riboflavin biosynthesis pyrimidine reductase